MPPNRTVGEQAPHEAHRKRAADKVLAQIGRGRKHGNAQIVIKIRKGEVHSVEYSERVL